MSAPTITQPLRVIQLTAENFKRLHAVDISPDPDAATVTIAGRNAQGKSSVLDAIWTALAGSAATRGSATTRPIRDGEDKATVRIDLGDLIVTRTWTGDKTSLTVTNADGAKYSSPQKMLDEFLGRLSFDPLAFASLPAKDQQAALLDLVDLPFNPVELAGDRRMAFDARTEIGRSVKSLRGQLDGYQIPDGTPEIEVSVTALVGELRHAQAIHRQVEDREVSTRDAQARLADAVDHLDAAKAAVARAEEALQDAINAQESNPYSLPDLRLIEESIDNAETINAAVRQRQARDTVAFHLDNTQREYDELTAKIAELDQARADGLAAAIFPIDGLGFDTDGVTYRGVPFAQASAAERLRVSTAMAMALNPRLRVIRITDGSLLDDDNLQLLETMAGEHGFQLWIERVGHADGVSTFVIEDGQVKA